MSKIIYILNGPNLNLLGEREPEVYGSTTLGDIEVACRKKAEGLDLELEFRQSNEEGILVDWIQEAGRSAQGIIINAAAYTHTSIALQDALKAVSVPAIEVHLSNIYQRENFRHKSFISPAASGIICGFGHVSYLLALDGLAAQIEG